MSKRCDVMRIEVDVPVTISTLSLDTSLTFCSASVEDMLAVDCGVGGC